MCGRFTLSASAEQLGGLFEVDDVPDMPPRYNIAPTEPVPAVRLTTADDGRTMTLLHWGLIPFWADERKIGARMINARSETAAEKPAFRAAFKRRRCLVPADGFYEWRAEDGGKQPYYFRRPDGAPFGIAGLWERWEGDDGDVIESCTLLTTAANDLVRPIHGRMPVVLSRDDHALWLDTAVDDRDRLQPLLRPAPEDALVCHPVSRAVNRPTNDGPELVEPLER